MYVCIDNKLLSVHIIQRGVDSDRNFHIKVSVCFYYYKSSKERKNINPRRDAFFKL